MSTNKQEIGQRYPEGRGEERKAQATLAQRMDWEEHRKNMVEAGQATVGRCKGLCKVKKIQQQKLDRAHPHPPILQTFFLETHH